MRADSDPTSNEGDAGRRSALACDGEIWFGNFETAPGEIDGATDTEDNGAPAFAALGGRSAKWGRPSCFRRGSFR